MTETFLRSVRPLGGDPVDVVLRDGIVDAGGVGLDPGAAEVIEGGARLVLLPGFVDLHTHLREPGREDAETVESGTRAAAVGGYTAVLAMPNTEPVLMMLPPPESRNRGIRYLQQRKTLRRLRSRT